METQNIPQPEVKDKPGGFWIRLLAYILDGIILIPLAVLSTYNMIALKSPLLMLISSIPAVVYKPFMEAFYGATLGKMAFSLSVVDKDGNRLSLAKAYVRFAPILVVTLFSLLQNYVVFATPGFKEAKTLFDVGQLTQGSPLTLLVSLLSYFVIVDCVFAAFTNRKRALHDMMAQSYCIRKLDDKKPAIVKILAITLIAVVIIAFIVVLLISFIAGFTAAINSGITDNCRRNLVAIEQAKMSYAKDHNLRDGSSIPAVDKNGTYDGDQAPDALEDYLKTSIRCRKGGQYSIGRVGESPSCSIGDNNTARPDDDHILKTWE